jgi:hypothetical protein
MHKEITFVSKHKKRRLPEDGKFRLQLRENIVCQSII